MFLLFVLFVLFFFFLFFFLFFFSLFVLLLLRSASVFFFYATLGSFSFAGRDWPGTYLPERHACE